MLGKQNILVTGMSGLIGGLVGFELSKNNFVRSLSRRPVEGIEYVQADINDLDAIIPAFKGIDTVVHMSAYLGNDDDAHLTTNVRGLYNVFEASRLAGVKRVVFGSSGSTVLGYEREEGIKAMTEARWEDVPLDTPCIDHTVPVRPQSLYGAVKVFGEAVGRYYSDEHGLSVICIRIGRVVKEDFPETAWHASCYLSHRDIIQMVEKCVHAPESVRFETFYAVSDNRGRYRDIDHARKVVGYVPMDGIKDWPE